MTRLTDEFRLALPRPEALRAVQAAVSALGWAGTSTPSGLDVRFPRTLLTYAGTMRIRLDDDGTSTGVKVAAAVPLFGPVPRQQLRSKLNELRRMSTDGPVGEQTGWLVLLTDCTVLGGYGHGLDSGLSVGLSFRDEEVALIMPTGEEMKFQYREIESLSVGGPGLIKSGGGFLGGGIGVAGAAEGIAASAVLNALTSHSHITTVLELRAKDWQVWLRYSGATPEALTIRLAGVFAKIRGVSSSASDGLISAELSRLHELHQQGVLTNEEFADAKARLIGRL